MDSERFPLELHKMAAVISFVICSAFSNWIALAYIHDFIGRFALPDIVFSLIEEQSWATPVGDFMVTMCSISLILLFIFHKHRVVVVRRILFIIGCLYTLRTIFMLVTQLPSPYEKNDVRCRPALNESNRTLAVYIERTLHQTLRLGVQDSEKPLLCGDLLFSGHTLIMLISPLAVQKYIDKSFQYLTWFPFCFALIGIPCMVISRTHYTCDILIAYLASKTIFTLYHAYCEIESSHERRRSILQTFMFIRIVSWLEANVCNYKLKNEFEIPLMTDLGQFSGDNDDRNKRDGAKYMSNSSSTAAIESI